jgi:hypothetical protein
MTTKLDGVLKRELSIGGEPYTLTLSSEGFALTLKGHRKGLDILWADLVGGDAALATALNASLTANIEPRSKASKPDSPGKSAKPETRSGAAKPEARIEAENNPGPHNKTAKPDPRSKTTKPKRRRSRGQ